MARLRFPLAGVALALLAGEALSQSPTCNLTTPPCFIVPCRPGCHSWLPIRHASADVCRSGGSFNLLGTSYEATCDGSIFGGCPQAGVVPPLRLWPASSYAAVNSGCIDLAGYDWLVNAGVDLGSVNGRGRWLLYFADWWTTGEVDGCPLDAAGATHMVAEISDVDAAAEGTVAHSAWYLIAAVPFDFEGADFDDVTGAPGCTGADVPVATVRGVTVVHVQMPNFPGCIDGPHCPQDFGRLLSVVLDEPEPVWYTDAGRNAVPELIAGYQILYASGDQVTDEPTSSDAAAGGWLPVRDPSRHDLALGVVPVGTTEPVDVLVPYSNDRYTWLAARLVYRDPELGPMGAFDPAISPGPLLVSPVSSHGEMIDMTWHIDWFNSLCASSDDGLPADQPVPPATPVTLRVSVSNPWPFAVGGGVSLALPACIDLTGFDPDRVPRQVEVTPGPATVEWRPATRSLGIQFDARLQSPDRQSIEIRGLAAGAGSGDGCCLPVTIHDDSWVPHTAWDEDLGCGETCFEIGGSADCPVPPGPVIGLVAVRAGSDVALSWDEDVDPPADHDDVWRVTGGDPALIPLANAITAATDPAVTGVCLDQPKANPRCTDPGAAAGPPDLVFYQVRAACADGTEGTAHR